MPRPTPFRDALQVSAARIASMNDTDLGELMRDLFRAQAHLCDSSRAEVRVNTEEKASDGGCDGWTEKPEVKDPWLGDTNTCWQFKAGTAGSPSRLRGEVLKSIPRDTLCAGGRFVVIASGSNNGSKGEADRLETLKNDASNAVINTSKIDVIGSERLTNWCNQHPAVAARWAGRPAGLMTLGDWSSQSVHQVSWQAPPAVINKLKTLRADLEFEMGSVQHIHIHGHPGVGKTRFALELCRDASWSPFVIYVPQASDPRLAELLDSASGERDVRFVVVADEVQPTQLRPLRDSIERSNGRIRLITIGHCGSPDSERIPAFRIEPMDHEMAVNVVRGWYPAMPVEHVDFVVRFADGFIRLARLVAQAISRDTTIDVRGLLNSDDIRHFLDGMLGAGDRRALHVVAILSSVGWTDEVQIEGEAVARHLGLDWNDARAKVGDFHQRLGIAPQGGRYRYISPLPLGIYLAVEAWAAYPNLMRSLPQVLPNQASKEAYYSRLEAIASAPNVRRYAQEELRFFFRSNHLKDVQNVRRWSALAAADPDKAARNVFLTLSASSIEDRLLIADKARRYLVHALVRLAWRPGAFASATKALALLGEAENEIYSNNATSEFIARFQIMLGGTSLPYMDRLTVLDELTGENRAALTSLVVRALAQAGNWHETRTNTDPASDAVPEKEWHPATRAEHLECVIAALERLTNLAEHGEDKLQDDLVSAANKLAWLLRDAWARPSVRRLFESVLSAYPNAREPLRRAISSLVKAEREHRKELSQEELAELDALHAHFEDSSLKARLKQHVGEPRWESDKQADLRPLAKELLESFASMSEVWPWLTSGEATYAWYLGEALSEEDPHKAFFDFALSLNDTGRDLRILCGYVAAWRRKLGDEWFDEWFKSLLEQRPRPLDLIFQVAWRCGATAATAQCLADILRTDIVPPEIVGQLEFGMWGEGLAPDVLEQVFRAMVDSGHRATALAVIEHRLKAQPGELNRWRQMALELVTAQDLIRGHQMTSYYWKELALKLAPEFPGKISEAIIRSHSDRSAENWFLDYSEAEEILIACLDRDPSTVWTTLLAEILSKDEAFLLSIGFPRGVVDRIPQALVLGWIGQRPDKRAPIIARLANKDLSSDNTLAARVLGEHGDSDEVANAYFSEFVSGAWSGPSSAHWDEIGTELKVVAGRTGLPKLRNWAEKASSNFHEMAERDRQREEEAELRGYH